MNTNLLLRHVNTESIIFMMFSTFTQDHSTSGVVNNGTDSFTSKLSFNLTYFHAPRLKVNIRLPIMEANRRIWYT